MSSPDLSRHRPNVGVVLFNAEGQVWYGRRAGMTEGHAWQFPQGGVDPGEDLEAAARRELEEETGVTSAELMGRTDGWIVYDFPEALKAQHRRDGRKPWDGQKQVWFAFRFTGEDAEIALDRHEEVEFDAWRWGRLEEAPELIVPFKRDAYEQVVAAFTRFAS
ncbi:RNA pyrophosphohydrolase [Brevundimonas sp. AAP58]|uniref:RNA pyrophosphohydrolase n=1 Tax=Brevundimonas sp. AAP58 TaxID=1523422 RepID=UPI0006B94DB3|nr:RNA pyrophosphohydrolase [Brevundimonas sp. AAP58]KPF81319.1 RNA pyrophosphohydrolase [Brevundimonas sp. AAP58]